MSKTVLKVDQVGMKFNLNSEKVDDLKDYIIKFLKHQLMYKEFWALKEISFEVQEGDRVGILGLNGAGKSTLLKVVAGVLKPTEGSVEIKSWGQALTSSIPERKIFSYTGRCLGIPRNLSGKNMRRL